MNALLNWDSKKMFNGIKVIMLFVFIYVFFSYIIPFFLPFFVGLLISAINVPCVNILERNFKIKRKLAVSLSMFLTISVLAIIVIFGVINIYNELIKLEKNLSTYLYNTRVNIQMYYDQALNYYNNLPPNVSNSVSSVLKSFEAKSKDLLSSVLSGMIGTLQSIPSMMIFTVVTLLSAFFFSSDSRKIKVFVLKQMPKSIEKNLDGFRADALKAFVGYLKAVFILMAVTCVEVSIGLLIIGADYAISMGFIIGICEAVPLFGTGMIMIPWILWNLIIGNMSMATGLAIIFVLGIIIRQILEPKIMGDTMGLNPLATLFVMYIGIEAFGFLGLFIGPFSLIILKSIQKSGIVKLWEE